MFLIMSASTSHAEGSYLVADRGIRVSEKQLVSTPAVRSVEAVVPVTEVNGDVQVSTCVEYDGGECVPSEKMGFFSIVTAKDI